MNSFSHLAIYSGISLLGMLFTLFTYRKITSLTNSDKRSAHIASLIRLGAMTFLRQEYTVLAFVIVFACAILTFVFNGVCAAAYAFGALSSMLAGYIGWDGDGYYLRQVLLIYAGGMGAITLTLAWKD